MWNIPIGSEKKIPESAFAPLHHSNWIAKTYHRNSETPESNETETRAADQPQLITASENALATLFDIDGPA